MNNTSCALTLLLLAVLALGACGLKPQQVDSHRGKPLPSAVPPYPNPGTDPTGTVPVPPELATKLVPPPPPAPVIVPPPPPIPTPAPVIAPAAP